MWLWNSEVVMDSFAVDPTSGSSRSCPRPTRSRSSRRVATVTPAAIATNTSGPTDHSHIMEAQTTWAHSTGSSATARTRHDAMVDDASAVIGFAHRGARAHAPENTIDAFLTACRMGARALETDVWLTRDRVPVIDHDGWVGSRLRSRPISQVDLRDLPSHMPALAALQAAIGPHIDLSIDVKDPDAIGPILATRGAGGTGALTHTWLCDPDVDRLAAWRSLDPDVHLVASIRRRTLRLSAPGDLARAGIEVANLRHVGWTRPLIDECHGAGLKTFAWGVQCPARMRTLIRWGIDGIYSDHTDRMVDVITTSRYGSTAR